MKALRAGLEHKRGSEALDVLRVDLVQRAEPLPIVGAVVGDPVMRLT